MSTAGTSLVNVVIAFAVLHVGGDGFDAGLVLASSVLTQTVLLPLGGVLADRVSRSFLAVAGNTVLAAVQAVMGALLIAGHAAVWMFAGAAAVTGAAAAAVQPAFQGLIVQLVPATALQRANASLRLVLNLSRIAAPGLGSLLGAAFGFGRVLLVAGASFAACVLVLLLLRVPQPVQAGTTRRVRAGWQAFRSRPWMWAYALSCTITVPLWLAGYQLLGPLILSGRQGGAAQWGWAVSVFSAGLVLGSVVALRWRPRRLMLACVLVQIVWPLPLAVLAAGPRPTLLLGSMLISGIGLELAVVLFETAKQQQVPERLIGRVTSLIMIGENALVPLGYLLAGTVADRLGAIRVMWICCLGILACNIVLLLIPSLRRLPARTEVRERP
ncbi:MULTISPECIES: MFS transporter [unclassified Nocardia]|uniref:MFS transporter n=1 Tax=unclassified Nocardia TaxID=2637762 RepID=UPI001CE43998|nr:MULTISPECIES: MFS transporter [unclassified Nocardia]